MFLTTPSWNTSHFLLTHVSKKLDPNESTPCSSTTKNSVLGLTKVNALSSEDGSLQQTYLHPGQFKDINEEGKIQNDDNFSQTRSARLNMV